MLSIIAKTAIIHTDESAHKKDQTTFQDIGRLLDIFHDHLHEKQFENAKKKSGKLSAEDLHSFVIRLTQQQLRYQRGFHQELARSLLIYNDLLKQKRQRIDYEKAFHELYGMNLERFLQIAYAIWVSYRELKPDRHKESEIINYCRSLSAFAPSEFICVFERLSVDATKFRELAEKKKIDDPAFEYYEFNPLRIFPIFSISEDEIVIPSFYEYIFRLTDGIYYDLFNKFFDRKNTKSNPFTEDLGEVFEEYTKTLWGATHKELTPEFEYCKGQKFSDFSILEHESLFLIELKAKRLCLPTRVTGATKGLKKDMETGVVEALIQIQKKIDNIRKGIPGLTQYGGVKEFYGIVLTLDQLYIGNTPAFRDVINEMLAAKGIQLEFQYQIMEIDEFEGLIEPFKRGMTWSQLLSRKLQPDLIGLSFKSLVQITPLHSVQENALLNERFEIFNKTIERAISPILFPSNQVMNEMERLLHRSSNPTLGETETANRPRV